MILYDSIYQFALALLWAVFISGIVWYAASAAARITYVTMADGRRQERKLPVLLRVLLPLTPTLKHIFAGERLLTARKSVFKKLASAGFDDVISPDEYLSLLLLTPLVIGSAVIITLFGLAGLSGKLLQGTNLSRTVMLAAALLIWLALYPRIWLNGAVTRRHNSIQRALPFVIDLLTLSVEAGLDFMAAVRNIVSRRKPDALGEELSRTILEIQLGSTRRQALKHMADRINQQDISTLVVALTQADELGVSIGAILRIQSDQVRSRRFMRAEKLANEAPVKMLFPLIAFIFPAVFLILLGPVALTVLQRGI